MLNNKNFLLFLVKGLIIYGLLFVPMTFYDQVYGGFYRKVAGVFFGRFRENGFVQFREWKKPEVTRVYIGNYTLARPDGTTPAASFDVNTRYMGYIPTIFLMALILASPVKWKRRLIALAVGLILVTLLIVFKQWIALLWYCEGKPWLQLTNFTETGKKILTYANTFISASSGTVLYFVGAIWVIATFRVEDFKAQNEKKQ